MTIRAKRGNPPRGGATPPRSTGNPPPTHQWATPRVSHQGQPPLRQEPRLHAPEATLHASGVIPPRIRGHASTLQEPRSTPQESYLLTSGAEPPRHA